MYVIVTKGGPGKGKMYREFMIPTIADVSSLPTQTKNANGDSCEIGSLAFTQGMGHMYQLGTDNAWHEC